MTTTLFLVRHGETEFNTRGIYQGQLDSPLTPDGVAQAKALGITAPRPFDIGNTSLSIVERDDDAKWKIRTLGELAHFDQMPKANQTEG